MKLPKLSRRGMAWSNVVGRGMARRGEAGKARIGKACYVTAGTGKVRLAGSFPRPLWLGLAWQEGRVMDWPGSVGPGAAGTVRSVKERQRLECRGSAGMFRNGAMWRVAVRQARIGKATLGVVGTAWQAGLGVEWLVSARQERSGKSRNGKECRD